MRPARLPMVHAFRISSFVVLGLFGMPTIVVVKRIGVRYTVSKAVVEKQIKYHLRMRDYSHNSSQSVNTGEKVMEGGQSGQLPVTTMMTEPGSPTGAEGAPVVGEMVEGTNTEEGPGEGTGEGAGVEGSIVSFGGVEGSGVWGAMDGLGLLVGANEGLESTSTAGSTQFGNGPVHVSPFNKPHDNSQQSPSS